MGWNHQLVYISLFKWGSFMDPQKMLEKSHSISYTSKTIFNLNRLLCPSKMTIAKREICNCFFLSQVFSLNWAVLSDEQMSYGWPFSLLNDEQMSNWLGVEHQPVNFSGLSGLVFWSCVHGAAFWKWSLLELDLRQDDASHRILCVPWSKVAILGMVIAPLIGILIMGI